jgi:hypothetical protein
MKKLILALIFLISFSSFNKDPGKTVIVTSLEDALKAGSAKLNVTGLGNHSGVSLSATLKNNTPKPILIEVPAGLIFNPSDTSMQDILIVKTEQVSIPALASKSINLIGYCCEATNRSPEKGVSFKIAAKKNVKLQELAKFINSNPFEEDDIQAAVWCVSDGKSVSEIYNLDRNKVEPLRNEVCRITGQKNEWFSKEVNYLVDSQGYINPEPVLVSGLIHLENVKPGSKLKQEVCKANGEVIWKPAKESDLGRGGKITYNFNLKVTGWEKGKYYVKATIDGREVMKKEFEI